MPKASVWVSNGPLCDPGIPRMQPFTDRQAESATATMTTIGLTSAYAVSWCQPAKVRPSAALARSDVPQHRMSGPIRSSVASRMPGSRINSSTQVQIMCAFWSSFKRSCGWLASKSSSARR